VVDNGNIGNTQIHFSDVLLIIFQIYSKSENDREANEMYDAIKEGVRGIIYRVGCRNYLLYSQN
jgi:hypothetical protein